jgi:tRNA A37 threonylcarbamoyladenosine biosynthesis protein TsaE
MGLEELLEDEDAVVAVEWADRVTDLLPPDHLLVDLDYGEKDETRVIRVSAFGATSREVLQRTDF